MSTITAVLGLSQLGKLEQLIKKRRDNAEYISSRLSKFSQIITPNEPSGYEHIFQMYTIRLPNKQIRDSLHDFLIKKRIFSKVYFEPIHQMSLYRKKNSEILPITEKISEQVLTLPMYPNMEKDEKDYLIDSISEFFETL
jgi:perosamine synthetase